VLLGLTTTYCDVARALLPDDAVGYEAVEVPSAKPNLNILIRGFDDLGRVSAEWTDLTPFVWINGRKYIISAPDGYKLPQIRGQSPSSGVVVGRVTSLAADESLGAAHGMDGPFLLGLTPWAFSTVATDANDFGAAAGYSTFPTAPILWRPGEDGINLGGLPGGTGKGSAYALNAFNEVVGESTDGNFEPQPFLWTESGGMIDLTVSHPDVIGGYATDINDLTEVVGTVRAYDKNQAFFWRDGQMILLPDDCPTKVGQQFAQAINNRGVIVGRGPNVECTETSAAVWWETEQPGEFRKIDLRDPTLDVRNTDPGFAFYEAKAVNNGNQIVAGKEDPTGFDYREYILTPFHHTMSDLVPGRAGERNRLSIGSLEPGTEVYLIWGSGEGAQTFDAVLGSGAGNPPIDCLGGPLLIQNVRGILGPYVPDLNGDVHLEFFIPPSASHRTARLQAVVPATCRVSHVVTVEIE